MPSLKKGRKNNTLLSGRTKPDLNTTQTLKLPYRHIKVIMIKLVKSVVEKGYMMYDKMCNFTSE